MLVMYCANDEWKLSENCALDATDVDCVDFADVTGVVHLRFFRATLHITQALIILPATHTQTAKQTGLRLKAVIQVFTAPILTVTV